MKIEYDHRQDETQIVLTSDLPEDLAESQQKLYEDIEKDDRYTKLFLWSQSKFMRKPDQYQKYEQYEIDPQSALTDALSLLSDLSSNHNNRNLIIYISAVLLMEFGDRLDDNSTQICSESIVNNLHTALNEQWYWSVGGIDAVIAALPVLISSKVERSLSVDPLILMLILICDWSKQRDWAVAAFREKLWCLDSILAKKLFRAFILIKPGYDQKVTLYNGISPFKFIDDSKELLQTVFDQQDPGEIPDVSGLSDTALQTLNLLLPIDIPLARTVISMTGKIFWPRLFEDQHHSNHKNIFRDMNQEQAYLSWLAEYLLCTTTQERHDVVTELAPNIVISDMTNSFLTKIILSQDQMKKPQAFWNLWDKFFIIIDGFCSKQKVALLTIEEKDIDRYYGGDLDKIVTTYLLAFPLWQENICSWHTLQEKNIDFFVNAAQKLSYHPGTLYSIARVLNTIGYDFLDHGIKWLALVIRDNPHLKFISLETNTEFYIEEYTQRFISSKRTAIKQNSEIRRDTLDVLSFLVDRGSTCGFMLRDSVI